MTTFMNENFSTVANGANASTSTVGTWTQGTNGAAGIDGTMIADSSNRIYYSTKGSGKGFAWYADTRLAHRPVNGNYTITASYALLSAVADACVFLHCTDPSGGSQGNGYGVHWIAGTGISLSRFDAGIETPLGWLTLSDPAGNFTLSLRFSGNGSMLAKVSGGATAAIMRNETTYQVPLGYGFGANHGTVSSTTGAHLISIVGVNQTATPTTWEVAKSGNDSTGNGTIANPYLTPLPVSVTGNNTAYPGDSIHLNYNYDTDGVCELGNNTYAQPDFVTMNALSLDTSKVAITIGLLSNTNNIFAAGHVVSQAVTGASGTIQVTWPTAAVPNVLQLINIGGSFDTVHAITDLTSGASAIPAAICNPPKSFLSSSVDLLTANYPVSPTWGYQSVFNGVGFIFHDAVSGFGAMGYGDDVGDGTQPIMPGNSALVNCRAWGSSDAFYFTDMAGGKAQFNILIDYCNFCGNWDMLRLNGPTTPWKTAFVTVSNSTGVVVDNNHNAEAGNKATMASIYSGTVNFVNSKMTSLGTFRNQGFGLQVTNYATVNVLDSTLTTDAANIATVDATAQVNILNSPTTPTMTSGPANVVAYTPVPSFIPPTPTTKAQYVSAVRSGNAGETVKFTLVGVAAGTGLIEASNPIYATSTAGGAVSVLLPPNSTYSVNGVNIPPAGPGTTGNQLPNTSQLQGI
jgi:hypothetical protein